MQFTSTARPNPYILAETVEEMDTRQSGSDRWLLSAIIALSMAGLMAVFSAIAYFAETKGTTAHAMFLGHAIKLMLAIAMMLIFSKVDYKKIAKYSKYALFVSWALLIGVMLFGASVFGARRWITIGGVSFQPSTLASISLLMYLSVMLHEKQEYIRDFARAFIPTFGYVVVTCALIGLENYSSSGVLFAMSMILMFAGRIPFKYLGTLLLIGALGSIILINQNPERLKRVQTYLDQVIHLKADDFALGDGYQPQQAQIAIARGEIFGVGTGKSSQRDFLPAPYNDFIYAIIAEEYGLVGTVFIISMFALILVRGILIIAKNAPDEMSMLMATGATLYVTMMGFINAGVASGLLPVTGLPMPFVSYGGTSMIFTAVLVGVLLNISKHRRLA
jgi:cell division protein FtsW